MIAGLVDPLPLQEAQFWLTLAKIAVSLGIVTAFSVVCRYFWNRYRWRLYRSAIDQWLQSSANASSAVDHPKLMKDDDWRVLCESKLSDAYFSPFEINQLLDLAVVTARGIVLARII